MTLPAGQSAGCQLGGVTITASVGSKEVAHADACQLKSLQRAGEADEQQGAVARPAQAVKNRVGHGGLVGRDERISQPRGFSTPVCRSS